MAGRQSLFVAPAYSVSDAARYLDLPQSTVRSWVLGRSYSTLSGRKQAKPVIHIADKKSGYLSFLNLVEVHVLGAIRRRHKVRLPEVRNALSYLEKKIGAQHPLVHTQMSTDGKDLFIDMYGELVNISQAGQLAMKKVLELHLSRIERDTEGLPIRLFPFTTSKRNEAEDRPITIDPRRQFGRPCIAGTRIPSEEVAERYKAGESIDELAEDFSCERKQIEAAIRYEFRSAA
jgi:uncharacterized protein (DUF433 family)/transposase-like protein